MNLEVPVNSKIVFLFNLADKTLRAFLSKRKNNKKCNTRSL